MRLSIVRYRADPMCVHSALTTAFNAMPAINRHGERAVRAPGAIVEPVARFFALWHTGDLQSTSIAAFALGVLSVYLQHSGRKLMPISHSITVVRCLQSRRFLPSHSA